MRREYEIEQSALNEEVLLNVDFTQSTDDKTGNCDFYSGGGKLSYDTYKSTRGIYVGFSKSGKSAITYDMSNVITNIQNANQIEFEIVLYPTSQPYPSASSNNYQSCFLSTKSDGVSVDLSTSGANNQSNNLNFFYSGSNAILTVSSENILTVNLQKIGLSWLSGIDYTVESQIQSISGNWSTVNWNFGTNKFYFGFPAKWWSGPQNFYGYIKSMKLKVIY